jgi:hypothetical protein
MITSENLATFGWGCRLVLAVAFGVSTAILLFLSVSVWLGVPRLGCGALVPKLAISAICVCFAGATVIGMLGALQKAEHARGRTRPVRSRKPVERTLPPHLSTMTEQYIPRLSDQDLAQNVAAHGGLGKVLTFLEPEDLRNSLPEVLAGRVAANPGKVQILEYSLAGPLAEEASLVEVRFQLGAAV